ncbi:MAG: FliG C-terminal domain-containing protein, partial [Nitrospinota bacterium]
MSSRRRRDWDEGSPGGEEGRRKRGSRPDLAPLARMSGRALRRLIERLDMDTLSLALREAPSGLVQRVLRNVSSRTAAA